MLAQSAHQNYHVIKAHGNLQEGNFSAAITGLQAQALSDGLFSNTEPLSHRLVPIRESGWKNFDVTQAVHYWLRNKRHEPMFLEVWIEGERVGSHASEMAKAVRFTSQDPKDKALGKPELVLYTLDLEDYGYVRHLLIDLCCLWCSFAPELLHCVCQPRACSSCPHKKPL